MRPSSDQIKAPSASGPDTRTRLLNVAERLFAESGIAETSLRKITHEAGANIAAVNYHFGSKAGLVEEVFGRRIRPLTEDRLRRLRAVEEAAGDRRPTLEGVLVAFLAPVQRVVQNPSRGGRGFLRLMARANMEPGEEIREIVYRQFEDAGLQFFRAFQRALPELTPTDIFVRFRFCLGAMFFTFANILDPRQSPLPFPPPADAEMFEDLVAFLAAGFRTPSLSGGKP